jgi:type II secretory pathway component GspD/PulD (secretin)
MKEIFTTVLVFALFIVFAVGFANAVEKKTEERKPRDVVVKITPEKKRAYKLIPLGASDYGTVEKVIKAMMTGKGVLAYEKNRNSVLVYDTEEVIKKVSSFLRGIDRETVNIKINIDYEGAGISRNDSINIRGGKKKNSRAGYNDGKILKHKKAGATFTRRSGRTSGRTSQFIVTKSGSPATLWVGKTVVDPSWLNNVIIRPNIIITGSGGTKILPGIDPDIKWADVGASLKVLPRYYDDGTIDVEVYPTVSFIDGRGHRRSVKVQQLITRVRVNSGRRIYIGGLISGKSEMYSKLFGPDFFNRHEGVDVLDMYLTATAINPAGRPGRPVNNLRTGR